MVLSKDELGKLVKEARKNKSAKIGKRYTQIMLAKDIKKSQSYIGDIESGRTYPTFKVLSIIAEICEVPFGFFGTAEIEDYLAEDNCNYSDSVVNAANCDNVSVNLTEISDVKTAMDLVLSQPGLMLNGDILSYDSKIALANAIKLGLQYAEQMQSKEKSTKYLL